MTEGVTRDRIIDLPRELPADATIEDAIEALVSVAQIERGIAELDAGQACRMTKCGVDSMNLSPRASSDLRKNQEIRSRSVGTSVFRAERRTT